MFSILDPYDCSSNPCHLSWLTKYNRDLLKQVDLITCSNGIRVADLPENNFASCPVCHYSISHVHQINCVIRIRLCSFLAVTTALRR